MPSSKDLKRLTRSRMKKTGESYTAARAQLIAKRTGPPARPAVADYAELAGLSDAAVRKATGRDWKSWVRELDAAGAVRLPHRDIARLVHDSFAVGDWWAQGVTVGYERIRGLREKGQRRGGGFEINKSKTLPVAVDVLYDAFATARVRKRWLGGVDLTVQRATPPKSIRLLWSDGTRVEAYLQAKGPAKSQVQVQHRGLPSRAVADTMRALWTDRLAKLEGLLTVRPRGTGTSAGVRGRSRASSTRHERVR
ncbi:MAG: hypothetical protein ACT4PE_06090 [Candidatus Eiseniibacteriota bacterium]